MKIILALVVCLLPWVAYSADCSAATITSSDTYVCSETLLAEVDGICQSSAFINSVDNTGGLTYTKKECPSSQFCDTSYDFNIDTDLVEYHCHDKYEDGHSCSDHDECKNSVCRDSVCNEEGNGEGDACSTILSCKAGYYCRDSQCYSQIEEGNYCNYNYVSQCEPGTACNGFTNLCTKVMTVDSGQHLYEEGTNDDLAEASDFIRYCFSAKICKSLHLIQILSASSAPYTYVAQCVDPPIVNGATADNDLIECDDNTDCTYTWMGEDITYSDASQFKPITAISNVNYDQYSVLSSKLGCSDCASSDLLYKTFEDSYKKQFCYPGGGEAYFTDKRTELATYMQSKPKCIEYGDGVATYAWCNEKGANEGEYLYSFVDPTNRIIMAGKKECWRDNYLLKEGSSASSLAISIIGLVLGLLFF